MENGETEQLFSLCRVELKGYDVMDHLAKQHALYIFIEI
jgi:hypothetical protein